MGDASRRFTIVYAPVTKQHLRAIEPKYYSLIRTAVEEQLAFEPTRDTRNRKPLKRPVFFEATWEIRFGADNRFRVYYDVNVERRIAAVLAIGLKRGDKIVIGGKEMKL